MAALEEILKILASLWGQEVEKKIGEAKVEDSYASCFQACRAVACFSLEIQWMFCCQKQEIPPQNGTFLQRKWEDPQNVPLFMLKNAQQRASLT